MEQNGKYILRLLNAEEGVDARTAFNADDHMDALVMALLLIGKRCERGIRGAHTLFSPDGKLLDLSRYLDIKGCPKAEYDPNTP